MNQGSPTATQGATRPGTSHGLSAGSASRPLDPAGGLQIAQAGGPAPHPIGHVEQVGGGVLAVRAVVGDASLAPGASIYQGDVIQTAHGSSVLVRFEDGTTFSVGGDARVVIDRLIYDPDAHTGSFLMTVVRGTFLFITGQIAHTGPDAVQVSTPSGVIGIRGTTFGCAVDTGNHGTSCVLLPDPDGHVGRVAFTNGSGTTVVSHALDGVLAASYLSVPESLHLTTEQAKSLLTGAIGREADIEPREGPLVQTAAATFETLHGAELVGLAALSPLGPQAPSSVGQLLPDQVADQLLFQEQRPGVAVLAAFQATALGVDLVPTPHSAGDTVPLPALQNGQDVFTSAAFAQEGNLIFGDRAALTLGGSVPSVTVSYQGGDGSFHSALGYYVVDPAGRIGEPHLLTTDLSALQPGAASSFVVDNGGQGLVKGATLALFLVADGHDLNPAFQTAPASAIQLRLAEETPGGLFPNLPDVGDSGLHLLMRVDGGKLVPVLGDLWQTTDQIGGLPIGIGVVDTTGLNVDPSTPGLVPLDAAGHPTTQHDLLGTTPGGGLSVSFEDSPLGAGDRDYQDVVLNVLIPTQQMPVAGDGAFEFGFHLQSLTGTLTDLGVEVGKAPAGDSLGLAGDLSLDATGQVLIGGAASGVTLDEISPTHWAFGSARPASTGVYETILNQLALGSTEATQPPGTRTISVSAAEPGGTVNHSEVSFVVGGPPQVGADGADQLVGTKGNDTMFGLGGDDILQGGRGDDQLAGGAGDNILTGGPGKDFFRIGGLADVDPNGNGQIDAHDTITDFSAKQGDVIDLSQLLGQLGATAATTSHFVAFTADPAQHSVTISLDLSGSGAAFHPLVTVQGTDDPTLVAARTLGVA